MSPWLWYAWSGLGMFGIGLWGVFVHPHLVRKILAANIAGSGVLLVLVALSRRAGGAADPVGQALVLTGIVVAVSATAQALAVVRRLAQGRLEEHADEHASDAARPPHEPSA